MRLKNKCFKVTIYDGGFCWKNPGFESVDFKIKDLLFVVIVISLWGFYAIS